MRSIGDSNQPSDCQTSTTGSSASIGAEKAVQSIADLPSMPHIGAQIMRKLANPSSTPREIHELIIKDQGLAVRVMKIANSPYYGASRSISSIKEAILFMGFDSIRSLVTTAVTKGVFSTMGDSGRQLWEHSICCAVAAKQIGIDLGLQGNEELFLAGLIHDIGKSVIFLQSPDNMREILLLINEGMSSWDAECQIIGFTHAEVGGLLANKWRFTLTIEDAVANHHKPDCSRSGREISHIVSLANSLCHKLGIGPTKRPAIEPRELASAKALGLGPAPISRTLELLTETIGIERKSE